MNGSGICSRDWILCPAACWRYRQHHLTGIEHLHWPMNRFQWGQCPELPRPSILSATRWHSEWISWWATCCSLKIRISPWRVWTPVLMIRRTDGISTMHWMILQNPKRNHQSIAGSHTVYGVLGFLMSLIGIRRKIAWAGDLCRMQELDSNLDSLPLDDSIHCMTGVIRRCGCFQVHLKMNRMGLWWKSMVLTHCFWLWRVWCMSSSLKSKMLNRIRHTGWYRLQRPKHSGGDQNWYYPMGHHSFGCQRSIQTLLIPNGLRTRKRKLRLFSSDTLHRVLREYGGYIDAAWHDFHWYWETPRMAITFQDDGRMNGHSILGRILQFSDGWERYLCQCFRGNLQSIRNLTKTKHQMRCFCTKVSQAPCLVQHLLNRPCYFVLCQAKFIIWSGGSQSLYLIISIFSTCIQKWAMISGQKCSSISKIRRIPLYW